MRFIYLEDKDAAYFDNEITPMDYEFFKNHKDTFKRMWIEQGREFWVRFIITFRSFSIQYGFVKEFPGKIDQYQGFLDEAFMFIHEQYVDKKFNTARNLIFDIVVVAQNRHTLPFLESKSYARDPFYNKDTRDVFRRLFGSPTEKVSYVKVYFLLPLYVKFGGAVCQTLRKWLDAKDISISNKDYWKPPSNYDPKEPYKKSDWENSLSKGIKEKSYHECTPDTSTDPDFRLFEKEHSSGSPTGPCFVTNWTLGDPRFYDVKNPLYDPREALHGTDWRTDLDFIKFKTFLDYVDKNYSATCSCLADECHGNIPSKDSVSQVLKKNKKKKSSNYTSLDSRSVSHKEDNKESVLSICINDKNTDNQFTDGQIRCDTSEFHSSMSTMSARTSSDSLSLSTLAQNLIVPSNVISSMDNTQQSCVLDDISKSVNGPETNKVKSDKKCDDVVDQEKVVCENATDVPKDFNHDVMGPRNTENSKDINKTQTSLNIEMILNSESIDEVGCLESGKDILSEIASFVSPKKSSVPRIHDKPASEGSPQRRQAQIIERLRRKQQEKHKDGRKSSDEDSGGGDYAVKLSEVSLEYSSDYPDHLCVVARGKAVAKEKIAVPDPKEELCDPALLQLDWNPIKSHLVSRMQKQRGDAGKQMETIADFRKALIDKYDPPRFLRGKPRKDPVLELIEKHNHEDSGKNDYRWDEDKCDDDGEENKTLYTEEVAKMIKPITKKDYEDILKREAIRDSTDTNHYNFARSEIDTHKDIMASLLDSMDDRFMGFPGIPPSLSESKSWDKNEKSGSEKCKERKNINIGKKQDCSYDSSSSGKKLSLVNKNGHMSSLCNETEPLNVTHKTKKASYNASGQNHISSVCIDPEMNLKESMLGKAVVDSQMKEGTKKNQPEGSNINATMFDSNNKNLRACYACQAIEPKPKTFRKCQKCRQEAVKETRYYCSKECQVNDWTLRHRREHKEKNFE